MADELKLFGPGAVGNFVTSHFNEGQSFNVGIGGIDVGTNAAPNAPQGLVTERSVGR